MIELSNNKMVDYFSSYFFIFVFEKTLILVTNLELGSSNLTKKAMIPTNLAIVVNDEGYA